MGALDYMLNEEEEEENIITPTGGGALDYMLNQGEDNGGNNEMFPEKEETKEEVERPSKLGFITGLGSQLFSGKDIVTPEGGIFFDDELGGKGIISRVQEAREVAIKNREQAKIAEIDSRYGAVKNETTGRWETRPFRERLVGTISSNLGQLSSYSEELASPATGTLNYMLSDRFTDYDEVANENMVLNALSGLTDFIGDTTSEGLSTLAGGSLKDFALLPVKYQAEAIGRMTGLDVNAFGEKIQELTGMESNPLAYGEVEGLTEAEETSAKYAGGELGTDLLFSGIGKGLSMLPEGEIKNLLKRTKKTKDIDTEITKQTHFYEQQNSVMDSGKVDSTELKTTLENLHLSAKDGKAGASDVAFVKERFGLTDLSFFEDTIADASKKVVIDKKNIGNTFDGYYTKMKPTVVDTILKSVDDLKITVKSLDTKKGKAVAKKTGYTPEEIKSAISVRDVYKATEPGQIVNTLLANKQFRKEIGNDVVGEGIKKLYDDGYVKIVDSVENPEFANGYALTKKGKTMVDKLDLADQIKAQLKSDTGFIDHSKDLWDGVTGDAMRKVEMIKKELSTSKELRELGGLQYERAKGIKLETNDVAIVNSLIKIDQKYKLGMKNQIDDIYDVVTGDINASRLEKAIDDINSTDNLYKFKNIKTPTGEWKNLKTELGYTQKVNNAIYKEAERITTIKFKSEISKLKQLHVIAKKKIIKIGKKEKARAQGMLVELERRYKAREIEINAKAKNIKNVQRLVVEQFDDLVKTKVFKTGAMEEVLFKSIIKKSGIMAEDISEKALNKAIKDIYQDITVAYVEGLEFAIKDALDIKVPGRTMPKNKRTKYSEGELSQLLVLKDLLGRAEHGDIPIQELENLLKEVEVLKTTGVSKANAKKLADGKANNATIAQIKKEGINKLEGDKNIIDRDDASLWTKVKGKGNTAINKLNFLPRLVERIFGGDGIAYDYFVNKTGTAYDKFDTFFSERTTKVMETLTNVMGDDIKDFGQWIFAQNRTNRGKKGITNDGFDRIVGDNLSGAHKPRDASAVFDEVPNDFPLSQAQRDFEVKPGFKFKDSKLAHTFEKALDDPRYIKSKRLWNSYNTFVGKKLSEIVQKNEGWSLNLRENYMAMKKLNGGEESIDMAFGSEEIMSNYINDNFLKETVENVKGNNYEYNPLNILASSGRQQVYYIHMKDVFDKNSALLRGKSIHMKNVEAGVADGKIKSGQYKAIDGNGNELDWQGVNADGDVITIDADGNKKLISQSEVTLQSKGGIMKELSPEAQKYMNEYMDTIAKGGSFANTGTERLVSQIVNQANVLPLLGNPSVVVKQVLSLIDAFGVIGTKAVFSGAKDLTGNPSLFNALKKVEVIKGRGGGDWLLKEQKPGTNIVSKGYSTFKSKMTKPMAEADQYVYATMWYSAYKDYLVKNGKAVSNRVITNFDNPKAMTHATNLANKTASTANPLWMPSAYKNVYAKSFFGIYTTQLNRVDELLTSFPAEWRKGEYGQAIKRASWFLTSNLAEIGITYGVGKFLYETGFSNYEEYNKDLLDNIFSAESLYRATIGQTFAGSKLSSVTGFGTPGLSPVLSLVDKIAGDLGEISDGKPEGALKAVADMFGGSAVDKLTTKFIGW